MEPNKNHHPRPCLKCGQGSAALVIRLGDAFCRGCFREYFVHKFRAMLGKNRVIFPGEKVLLALSGGPASSAMLQQVQEGLSRETAKRLRFVPGLIYVDEGAVRGQSPAQREQSLARMETLLQATGFPYHLAHLEQALELPASILRPGPEGSSEPGSSYKEAVEGFIQQQRQEGDGDGGTSLPGLGTQVGDTAPPPARRCPQPAAAPPRGLRRLFEAVETSTAREELLQMLRTHLILQTARTRGYAKVMTGESCTRVAVKLLTNLALGRGAFLAVDTGFVDNRHGDVMVVRPMREYMAKEIAFYNHFFDVPTVIAPPLPTKRREKPSIHQLMERFLLGLQEDFPSTISTVYRTGEKLSPVPAQEELALEPTLITEEPEPAGDGCCQDAPAAGAESRAAFIPLLCYSCRLTFKELGPLATLPPYVRAEAQRRIRRAQMKQQSQEVPLEDEEPNES
ncbi:PREDICTED: LOW QUALITY PROTEIN: cytoplasmic tRNA 2-thiolation protein 2 [Nipponia nippon]|uniref:LOW QUALITY PROTEIN: cytoplasmic tRNA 2-thiolation protein 2 n=1 Tax=Nipponia nippon TaxID=128390 RepID=UPI000510901A|nr:PREDICTED: LOW QUALITY PROTEIN: cytoplasmic tRNA 2-thiolation protein 2 [Nipponia nippon]